MIAVEITRTDSENPDLTVCRDQYQFMFSEKPAAVVIHVCIISL